VRFVNETSDPCTFYDIDHLASAKKVSQNFHIVDKKSVMRGKIYNLVCIMQKMEIKSNKLSSLIRELIVLFYLKIPAIKMEKK
jgi:hypothetical protein